MPTIFRFLTSLLVIALALGAIVFALGNFVSPNTRSMTIRLPPSRIEPRPVPRPPAPPPPALAPAPAAEGGSVAGAGAAEP
jgi:hypothetical protein